jgi:hypothetical protein
MRTECKPESYQFQDLGRRKVVADFSGGRLTSDAGALLLRQVEERFGVIEQLATCFEDQRDPGLIEHSVRDLVAQRVMALALGYEDLNDHDELRQDPLLAVAVGKRDLLGEKRFTERDEGKALAGKSTLNRLELSAAESNEYKKTPVNPEAVERLLVDLFIQTRAQEPQLLILDVDTTCDVVHGQQEGRFFQGFYDQYCYQPRYVFCGPWLLSARLKTADVEAAAGSVEDLECIVTRLREVWPEVEIWVRGDSSFARDEIMNWCEEQTGMHYVFGFARNRKLAGMIGEEMEQARRLRQESGQPARVYRDLRYRTRQSWSRERRVVAKAEYTLEGANPRYLVTSLEAERIGALELYEQTYCARGDMENRIKEQQMGLFADRTSTGKIKSNQLRLWFSSAAYSLLQLLREVGLKGTRMARAQCWTIRIKLLKIGAQIRVSVRRVAVRMASGCPYQDVFAQAYANLASAST